VLDRWLAHGDVQEGDWAALVVRRANARALARASRFLLDLPALAQPFSCQSDECTPGMRGPRTRSCCADVAVALAPWERRALESALPALKEYLAPRDPRWRSGTPPILDGDSLRRPGGTCVFAVREARGLRCGLQNYERRVRLPPGTLKPLPCRLFPLLLVDLGAGQRLLTAVSQGTAGLVETYPARYFPCLRGDPARPPLYRALRPLVREILGPSGYRVLARAAARYRRGRLKAVR
jgi:hypothetical protein